MSTQTRSKPHSAGYSVPVLALALTLTSMPNVAIARASDITPEELAMTPPYCPYTQTIGHYTSSSEGRMWLSRLGPSFAHMHHYCWGQINYQRALRSGTPENTRRGLLNEVRIDYRYVTAAATPDFVLLPEIYSRLGEVELRLDMIRDADKSFTKARALKPDYWPAYSHWAEYLIAQGKRSEARKVVAAGLKYSPNSKVLLAQRRLLDGR